jgi:hypothetical protein
MEMAIWWQVFCNLRCWYLIPAVAVDQPRRCLYEKRALNNMGSIATFKAKKMRFKEFVILLDKFKRKRTVIGFYPGKQIPVLVFRPKSNKVHFTSPLLAAVKSKKPNKRNRSNRIMKKRKERKKTYKFLFA